MKSFWFTIIFVIYSFNAQAFVITPTVADLELTGQKATTTYQVANRGDKEITISVFMKTRSYDEMGIESRSEFDVKKYFLVLPTTLKIAPHSTASVRVAYIGPKDLKVEKAYRVTFANMTPQKLKSGAGQQKTSLSAMVSYSAALYVSPKGTKAKLEIRPNVTKNGKKFFTLENTGNRRLKVSESAVEITAKNLKSSEKFPLTEFKSLKSPIMAGQKRLVEIPAKSKADKDSARIDIGDWQ